MIRRRQTREQLARGGGATGAGAHLRRADDDGRLPGDVRLAGFGTPANSDCSGPWAWRWRRFFAMLVLPLFVPAGAAGNARRLPLTLVMQRLFDWRARRARLMLPLLLLFTGVCVVGVVAFALRR